MGSGDVALTEFIEAISHHSSTIDVDEDSVITVNELKKASKEIREELKSFMQADSTFEVFHLLDEDGSGDVALTEFIEAISQHSSTTMSSEAIRSFKMAQRMKHVSQMIENCEKSRLQMEKDQRQINLRLKRIET